MSIFDKITDEEKDMIYDYIESYGGINSEKITVEAPLSHILRFWERNKVELSTVLGDNLIVSKDISFRRPQELIEDDICQMLLTEGREFVNQYCALMNDLCEPIGYTYQKSDSLRFHLDSLISVDSLALNTYYGETFFIPSLNGSRLVVKTGCKTVKILGKIAAAWNLSGFEKFRIAHSMCLNQKDMHGNLCLSIHPLDYITMSDNDCGWESCMSWREGGSYRQGTVEMMNSAYIVIAYLTSGTPMPFEDKFWNNKKWRQLFVVTPEVIMGIKQYPYTSEECEGIALNWLRSLAQKNAGWGPYLKTVSRISNKESNFYAEFNRNIEFNFNMNHMYNDIGSNQRGYLSTNLEDSTYNLYLSGESECMSCGRLLDDEMLDDDMVICHQCSGVNLCCCCGHFINLGDECYFEDECYCQDCYYENIRTCEFCQELTHEDNINSVRMRHGGQCTEYAIEVCENCLHSDEFKKEFGSPTLDFWSGWTVDSQNFSKYAWETFLPYPWIRERYQQEVRDLTKYSS